jgi:hypothetical protein
VVVTSARCMAEDTANGLWIGPTFWVFRGGSAGPGEPLAGEAIAGRLAGTTELLGFSRPFPLSGDNDEVEGTGKIKTRGCGTLGE